MRPAIAPDGRRATLRLDVHHRWPVESVRVERATGAVHGFLHLPRETTRALGGHLALADGEAVRLAFGRLPDGRALDLDVRLDLR